MLLSRFYLHVGQNPVQMCYVQNFSISVFRPCKENLNCSVNFTCFNLFSSEKKYIYVSTRKYSSRMDAARISGSGGRHRWRQTLPRRQIHLEADPQRQTPLGSRPPLEADPHRQGGSDFILKLIWRSGSAIMSDLDITNYNANKLPANYDWKICFAKGEGCLLQEL